MKKVIFCAFALSVFSLGYSQVNDVLQYGVAPESTAVTSVPKMSPAVDANNGLSEQTGFMQKVRVRQAGTYNAVWTVQDNGSGLGGNQARVDQTGNVGPFSGVENSAEVRQSGTHNQSSTFQEGDYNNALTKQGQNDDASARNKARIQQGVAQQGEYNFSNVTQDGSDNQAFTKQMYDNNDAWVTQEGEFNKALVIQNGSPNGSDGHSALVNQDGIANESFINQGGAGGRNTAKAVQLGNANHAKQVQSTDAFAGSPGNSAIISQGDGSVPTFLNTSILFGRILNIDPDFDMFGFSGNSFNGLAFQSQWGHENEAEIHQFGADYPTEHNYAEQNQNGARNDAYIVQNAYGAPDGGGNYARQDQMSGGDDNIAGIGQNGWGHKAYQRQFGDRNNTISTQRGMHNKVNTYQDGEDNWGVTKQVGMWNKAFLVQKGSNSYMIDQFGNFNQADVLQLGPDGDIYNDGEECIFPDEMPPMYIPDIEHFNLPNICTECN
jgi:hypothetical protein